MERYYRMVINLYKEAIKENYQVNSERILKIQREIATASTEARIKGNSDRELQELLNDLQSLKELPA